MDNLAQDCKVGPARDKTRPDLELDPDMSPNEPERDVRTYAMLLRSARSLALAALLLETMVSQIAIISVATVIVSPSLELL